MTCYEQDSRENYIAEVDPQLPITDSYENITVEAQRVAHEENTIADEERHRMI